MSKVDEILVILIEMLFQLAIFSSVAGKGSECSRADGSWPPSYMRPIRQPSLGKGISAVSPVLDLHVCSASTHAGNCSLFPVPHKLTC